MLDWSEHEIIIAMEFYYTCPERMHTDANITCREVAKMLGRTARALDHTIRTIRSLDRDGTGVARASMLIKRLVKQYKGHPDLIRSRAAVIREKNGWPQLDCGSQ